MVSSLALHYLADIATVFARIFGTLAPGGRFVFSVEHPVITSCDRGWQSGPRQAWLVDDYFAEGPRETAWLGGRVVKYHRTVEAYFAALQRAGFVVDRLREAHPRPERFADEAEFARRKRIPLFLVLAGHKPRSAGPD
ncbi:MAG: Ubiquinone/menaquinone biosynthesis methyltransferase UBIE [uncultured Thermomicrobiales bacterium]|uniref:Ubiquinone/menaquinone biosynthesis methyltransferase UBIE n=1 Tax=uncultured Thermomicrobiales bacterium TaxID=1645740 RepID=A0A6J4UIG8_9BACT|nr:MAG: Ubiquinone/menaquinone biosynthesis methyltransferase UBIE [uncultured Thermomicrobiales bacterium]